MTTIYKQFSLTDLKNTNDSFFCCYGNVLEDGLLLWRDKKNG